MVISWFTCYCRLRFSGWSRRCDSINSRNGLAPNVDKLYPTAYTSERYWSDVGPTGRVTGLPTGIVLSIYIVLRRQTRTEMIEAYGLGQRAFTREHDGRTWRPTDIHPTLTPSAGYRCDVVCDLRVPVYLAGVYARGDWGWFHVHCCFVTSLLRNLGAIYRFFSLVCFRRINTGWSESRANFTA